jgi:hypothetical protein
MGLYFSFYLKQRVRVAQRMQRSLEGAA